jgi:hypothetical protein
MDMFRPRCDFPALFLSLFALMAVIAVAADQPPTSQDSKKSTPSANKDSANKDSAAKPAPGTTQPGGMVVFIDPATGQIRQPDPSEIGTLVTLTNPPPKAPEPALIQGPGNAVGARLGGDAMTYVVVTTTPDGKLDMDCVTGEKAAAARVAAPAVPTRQTAVSAHPQNTRPQTQHPQEPQDTRNVKNQR